MPVDAPAIPSDLLTKVCPNCAYSLDGLPDTGTCPECGRPYDQSEVILYGWARGRHENISNAKRSRIVWLLILPFLYEFPQIIFNPVKTLTFIVLGVSLPVAYLLFRRQSSDHPGLIQVRLNNRQCVQYNDLTGPSVIRELLWSHGWLLPLLTMIALLVYVRSHHAGIELAQFWIWFPIAAITEFFVWRACRRFRRALRQVRDGSIADLDAAYSKPAPWSGVLKFQITPAQDDTYRLQIERFATITNHVVDAEIRCTSEQATQLKELIHLWIAQARPPAA